MKQRWTRWAGAALLISAVWWLNREPPPLPHSLHSHTSHLPGTVIPQIGHAGGIRAFTIAPDAKTVVTLGETIKFWDMDTGALRRTLSVGATVWQPRNLRFSPGGKTLAFLDDTPNGTNLHLIDVASGHLRPVKTGVGHCRDFAFVQETQICLNTYNDLRTYDIETGRTTKQVRLTSAYPWGAVADGIALVGSGKNWELYSLETGHTQNLKRDINLQAAAFSADGNTLVTGQNRFPAPVPVAQGKVSFSLLNIDEVPPQIKRAVQPEPDPPFLEAPDGTVALWDARRGRLRRVITAFPAQVGAFRNLAASRDGRLVAAYGSESYRNGYRTVLKQWDSKSGQLKGTWLINADGFLATTMAIGDDGTISMAGLKTDSSGVAGAPYVWSTRTRAWQGINSGVLTDEWKRLEWSPDRTLLAGGSEIGMAPRGMWGTLSGYYYSSYSLSGAMPTFVFSGGAEFRAQTVRLWDLQNGAMRRSFWGPIMPPRSTQGQGNTALQQGGLASVLGPCTFSPDGRLMAVDEGGAVVLRDVNSGAIVRTLASLPANGINVGDWAQFLWSPQGTRLLAITKSENLGSATQSSLQSLRLMATLTLWDTQNGKLKAILTAKARTIEAAFTADGNAVVALLDKVPHGWEAAMGTPLNVAALPALPRGARELCPSLLTRQGQLLRALSAQKSTFLETREVLTGKLMRYEFPPPFNGKAHAPRKLFMAPDGSSVAVLQANGVLALWNLRDWKLLGNIALPPDPNLVAAPAPGGRLVAIAAPEGAIQIFDPVTSSSPLLTLQVLPSLQPQRGGHNWAIFSPDGFCATSQQAPRQLQRLVNGTMLPP